MYKPKNIIKIEADSITIDVDENKKKAIIDMFIDYYKNKTGKDIKINIRDGKIKISSDIINDTEIFNEFMSYSIKNIAYKLLYSLDSAIERIMNDDMKELDAKTVFVMFDKMIAQINSLIEINNKILKNSENNNNTDKKENLFDIKKIQ